MDKRRAEEAEARRQAEQARTAETAKQPRRCIPSPNHEIAGLLPYALAPGDFVIDTTPPDPTLTAITWELLGLNDLKDCITQPTLGKCATFAMMVLPVGKIEALAKLREGVEGVVEGSRLAKLGRAKDILLPGGKPLGYEDSKGVQIITPDELQKMAQDMRQQFGEPDKLREIPGKGTVETWEFEGCNVNYRNFSSSGGQSDYTIDLTGDVGKEFGFKRYHAKQ